MDELTLDRVASMLVGAFSATVLAIGLWVFDNRFPSGVVSAFSTVCAQMIGLAIGFYVVAYVARNQRTIWSWFATGFLVTMLGAVAAIATSNAGAIAVLIATR